MRERAAFTIYELLAIVAILIVLALILFPVYRRTEFSYRRSDCLSNLKEVGKALELYANNNDDSLPMAYRPGSRPSAFRPAHGGDLTWADFVSPYAKSPTIWRCPEDEGAAALSYGLNEYFYRMPKGVDNTTITGGSLGELENWQSKLLAAETVASKGLLTLRPDLGAAFQRHGDGSNFLYADGHAVFHQPPEAWKTTPASVWEKPETAEKQPFPQWFPWQTTDRERW